MEVAPLLDRSALGGTVQVVHATVRPTLSSPVRAAASYVFDVAVTTDDRLHKMAVSNGAWTAEASRDGTTPDFEPALSPRISACGPRGPQPSRNVRENQV